MEVETLAAGKLDTRTDMIDFDKAQIVMQLLWVVLGLQRSVPTKSEMEKW